MTVFWGTHVCHPPWSLRVLSLIHSVMRLYVAGTLAPLGSSLTHLLLPTFTHWEWPLFPDNLLASPLRLLGMDLLAVHIWLSSLLWSIVIIFPYQWGSDGTTYMPLISFSLWRSPPMRSKVIQDLNLNRVDLQFSFASSVSLHFLLGILSSSIVLHPAVSLNHCSLQVDKVFPPQISILSSLQQGVSSQSPFSNTGWVEVSPSPRQMCQGGTCADVRHGGLLAFRQQHLVLYWWPLRGWGKR